MSSITASPQALHTTIQAVERFHDEHIRLGELLQAANLAAHEHIEPQMLREQLSSIFAYGLMHFSEEEEVMASVGFPELPAHRAEHCDILNRIQQQLAFYDSDPWQVSLDLLEMLELWMYRHVREVDSRYMRFLQDL